MQCGSKNVQQNRSETCLDSNVWNFGRRAERFLFAIKKCIIRLETMNWILISIFSHLSWGISSIIDKYLISNRIKNIQVFLVWFTWLGGLTIFALPWLDFVYPGLKAMLWLTVAGLINILGAYWYLKAIKTSEISRINIWWNLIPVVSLLFGWLFLKELPNYGQFVAMAILFTASLIGSINFKEGKKYFSTGFWWIVAMSIEFSLYSIIIRFVGQDVSIPFIFIYINFIRALAVLLFFGSKKFRKEFKIESKALNWRIILGIGLAVTFDYLGTVLGQWALKGGQTALVLSLESVQTLFVFFVSLFIAKLWPQALHESTDRKNLTIKMSALILVVVGIILLAYVSF